MTPQRERDRAATPRGARARTHLPGKEKRYTSSMRLGGEGRGALGQTAALDPLPPQSPQEPAGAKAYVTSRR